MTDTSHPTDDDRDTDPDTQPTRSNQSDEPHAPNAAARRGGVSGLLRQLLETIQRMDEAGESVRRSHGRSRSGETAFEYEYSVKLGLGESGDSAASEAEPEHPVSVEETLDGARVTVDLPAVDPEALQAGISDRRLTVAEDDDRLVRITLPETGYSVQRATYNNGILTIQLTQHGTEVQIDD